MDSQLAIAAQIALLLALGVLGAAVMRRAPRWMWFVAALALVALDDAALTRGYGTLPLPAVGEWNWTGKALALGLSLAVAALPAFGWRAIGLTLAQRREGRAVTWAVALALGALFTLPALSAPSDPHTFEDVAFQLTMPGFEEEVFYRGLLLLVLARAFPARWRFAGIGWHWGMLVSCAAFGFMHALGWENGGPSFDAMTFAMTAGPALALVWLRERSGSLLLPVLLHNWVNAASYFL